ncbi:hypothetical protein JZK55_08980 [Dissulfurispira thermophila]|uniref:Uncharacterized protein n=1 Tax=Dissulfurispira thermophila TaxID=2715679 RepID=A0A7G1H205_9BACT|nr:hypothetical protein [Dissulfurispira thermophila]BCB95976.1 hypothetical protein JZK55_08980 [Dissulfurispira thermophila]
MAKRFIDILRLLARDLIEKGYDADDALKKIGVFDIDFLMVKEELMTMELSRYIDDAELDTIKALLSYILMKETEMDIEEIYAFVFGKGRQITWN